MSAKVEPDAENPAPPPAAVPAWGATKEPAPMSHEEWSFLHKQCKALSYAHHLIYRPAPAKFICCFLDKEFAAICDQHQDSEKVKWAKSMLTLVILLFLPMGYGYAAMSYPCDPVVRQVQTLSVQNSAAPPITLEESRAIQCKTEDFLRSWASMYLGLAAVVVSFALWLLNLSMAGGCCGLRKMGTKLYTLQTSYVRPRLSALTVQPSRGPGSYEWPMCVYMAFLLEMLGVCVMLQSGMAFLIGIVAGNLFLLSCNLIYGVGPIFGAMVQGELAAVPILLRFFEREPLLQSTYASTAELACLWDGAKFNGECRMNEVVEQDSFPMGLSAMVRMHKFRQPFSRIPIFLTEVYIADLNATVNVITGVIQRQGKPVWSEATGLMATSGDDKKIP